MGRAATCIQSAIRGKRTRMQMQWMRAARAAKEASHRAKGREALMMDVGYLPAGGSFMPRVSGAAPRPMRFPWPEFFRDVSAVRRPDSPSQAWIDFVRTCGATSTQHGVSPPSDHRIPAALIPREAKRAAAATKAAATKAAATMSGGKRPPSALLQRMQVCDYQWASTNEGTFVGGRVLHSSQLPARPHIRGSSSGRTEPATPEGSLPSPVPGPGVLHSPVPGPGVLVPVPCPVPPPPPPISLNAPPSSSRSDLPPRLNPISLNGPPSSSRSPPISLNAPPSSSKPPPSRPSSTSSPMQPPSGHSPPLTPLPPLQVLSPGWDAPVYAPTGALPRPSPSRAGLSSSQSSRSVRSLPELCTRRPWDSSPRDSCPARPNTPATVDGSFTCGQDGSSRAWTPLQEALPPPPYPYSAVSGSQAEPQPAARPRSSAIRWREKAVVECRLGEPLSHFPLVNDHAKGGGSWPGLLHGGCTLKAMPRTPDRPSIPMVRLAKVPANKRCPLVRGSVPTVQRDGLLVMA